MSGIIPARSTVPVAQLESWLRSSWRNFPVRARRFMTLVTVRLRLENCTLPRLESVECLASTKSGLMLSRTRFKSGTQLTVERPLPEEPSEQLTGSLGKKEYLQWTIL